MDFKAIQQTRRQLIRLLQDFESKVEIPDLRTRVRALVPASKLMRKLGSSMVPKADASSGMARILLYLTKYPRVVIPGDELFVVSGILEWARRVRQLRVERGWAIVSGKAAKEMAEAEEDLPLFVERIPAMKQTEYMLVQEEQDRDAAYRWNLANEIRKEKVDVHVRQLKFLRANVGRPVTGEELRYVSRNQSDWARRVRELRTQQGWPVLTRNTGRPDLPVSAYVLEEDRQTPEHDRKIPDPVRVRVLKRDDYICRVDGWSHAKWNRSDPRHLELHHVKPHVKKGTNTEDNLITVCTVCHDDIHRKLSQEIKDRGEAN